MQEKAMKQWEIKRILWEVGHVNIPDEIVLKIMQKEIDKMIDKVSSPRIKNYYKYRIIQTIKFKIRIGIHTVNMINEICVIWNGSVLIEQKSLARSVDECWYYNGCYNSYVGYKAYETFRNLTRITKGYQYHYIVANADYVVNKVVERLKIKKYDNYKLPVMQALWKLNIFNLSWTPLIEQASKEKWLKQLLIHGNINAKSPFKAFSDWFSSGEKDKFNLWFEMFKQCKTYNHRTWIDYINMCKHKDDNDLYNVNFKEIHDVWNNEKAKIKQEQTKKIKARYNELYKLPVKKLDVKVRRALNKKDLVKLSSELSICVGHSNYEPKNIWIAKINNLKFCVEYEKNEFGQFAGYDNLKVTDKIKNFIIKKIIEKVAQGTSHKGK